MEVQELVDGRSTAETGPVDWSGALRRTVDITVAMILLLLLLPVLVVIALTIRLDSRGAVLFRQSRVGRQGRPFRLNKFRTMRKGADPTRHRDYVRQLITESTPVADPGRQQLFKLAVDDRITRVGRHLRRWSLDELPQLWNVVLGDMSLVGPRPVIQYEVEHYPGCYLARFDVKPGMTGLWQVSGRNERTYQEMLRLDVEYVERQSLRLDLMILARTPWIVLRRRGVA